MCRPPACRSRTRTMPGQTVRIDRKSTRLNSSHLGISYAVFCLKKKKTLDALRRKIAEFDRSCSRFREDAHLPCRTARAGKSVQVSSVLYEADSAALPAAEVTGR